MYILSFGIYTQYISQLVTSITGIQAQKTSATEEPFLLVTDNNYCKTRDQKVECNPVSATYNPTKRFLLLLLDKFGLQETKTSLYIALLIIGSKSGTILFQDTQFDFIMLRNTFTIFTIYTEKRVSNEKPSPHIKGKINL